MASGKGTATRREMLATLGALVLVACDDKASGSATGPADAGAKPDSGGVKPDAAVADTAVLPPVDATGTAAAPDAATPAKDAVAATNPAPKAMSPITPNDSHYITSCCQTAVVDPKLWKLTILDHGKLVTTFTLAELEALPAKQKEHTLECIGTSPYGQAISNAIWTGLPLQELLATKGVAVPVSKFLKFTSSDNYTEALPATDMAKPLWLVWRMNGSPLPHDHGYPARMLVPNRYGMKNPKWVLSIDFNDEDYKGFWEQGGWSNSAEYLPNAFIKEPRGDVSLVAGPMVAVGSAYCGSDQVVAVDVRVDKGAWQPAKIVYGPGPDIWALWQFETKLTGGKHKLQARCTTKSGKQSSEDPAGSNPGSGAGYDGSMEVELVVNG